MLQPVLDKSKIPSLAAVALVDGELKGAGAVGVRNGEKNEPVTIEDKYHIGSCTKSMTATLAAILIEEGVIEWDATIGDVLKDLKPAEAYRETTLRQLLSNRGGVPGDTPQDIWQKAWNARGSSERQREEFVEAMLNVDPAYPPGKGSEYSNAGFATAGMMLERSARKSWEDLMVEKIFKPLGMDSAGFGAPATRKSDPQPWGHTEAGKPVPPGPGDDNPVAIGPAGIVHCSLPDLAKYVRVHLLSETGPLVKKEESFQILHQSMDEDQGYAKGWLVTERSWAGGKVLTHAGSNTMFYVTIWIAPEKRFAALVGTNIGPSKGSGPCDEVVGLLVERYLR